MKRCFKCERDLPVEEFYRHPQMKDGRLGKCKDCTRRDVSQNYAARAEYYREYNRARGNRQSVEYRLEHRARNPIAYGARTMLGNAVRDGRVVKADRCEECGSTKNLHGHHDDYAHPLVVRWLCAVCHCAWHKINGKGANAS